MSSRSLVAQEEGPESELSPDSVAANAALVSSIRSSRRELERRSLLRKSAAARALQIEPRSARPQPPTVVDPTPELELPPQPTCASWRSVAARHAYLSTLPPPPSGAGPIVRVSHKA